MYTILEKKTLGSFRFLGDPLSSSLVDFLCTFSRKRKREERREKRREEREREEVVEVEAFKNQTQPWAEDPMHIHRLMGDG